MENGQQQEFYILEKDGVYRTVKRGFSWTAFFFISIVPLWRRDWNSFVYVNVIIMSTSFLIDFLGYIIRQKNILNAMHIGIYFIILILILILILYILWKFLWAKKYNEYYVRNLLRQGWELKEEIPLEAIPYKSIVIEELLFTVLYLVAYWLIYTAIESLAMIFVGFLFSKYLG